MTTKFDRQGAILRLVQERSLSTQEELAEALHEVGLDAVQATVSRDPSPRLAHRYRPACEWSMAKPAERSAGNNA